MVNYAKRQQGRRVHAAQSTIFTAESEYGGGNPGNLRFQHYLVPTIASRFGAALVEPADNTVLQPATALCVTLCESSSFCFFYTALVFNPRETKQITRRSPVMVTEFVL